MLVCSREFLVVQNRSAPPVSNYDVLLKTVCSEGAVCNESSDVASCCGFETPEGVFYYSTLLLSFGLQSSCQVLLGMRPETAAFDEPAGHKG